MPKSKLLTFPLFLAFVASNAFAESKSKRDIYDGELDGAAQIAEALEQARHEKKRVILQFGANWCGWCHLLHRTFKEDGEISQKLEKDYILVLIDVNKGNNRATDQKYGNPTQFGLPVLVVLDADGSQLTTLNTSSLEKGDGYAAENILRFLDEWSPSKA